jgi:glutamate mutase epsilon subunit
MGASIRSVPTEISLIEFQNACKDFKALEAKILKEKTDAKLLAKANAGVDLLADRFVQFNGTLIRGVM